MSTRVFPIGAAVLFAAASPTSAAAPDRASTAGRPPVVAAVEAGDRAALLTLVAHRADVNVAAVDGTTPLHWAVRQEDLANIDTLLAAGANPNAANRYGVTPLSLAASAGRADIIERLVARGADAAAAERSLPDGQTLLMLAARTGSTGATRSLIARGARVNAKERRSGTTALMWAAMENRADVVRMLLQAGADADTRSDLTHFPHTPPAVIGDKLEDGVSYVGQTVLPKGGWTALMYAAREGAIDSARALVGGGAGLDIVDPDGSSALIFALINGHFEVAALLVDAGANPNLADATGMTPLYAAVDLHTVASTFGRPDPPPAMLAGSVRAIEMLLAHGANPNVGLKTRILKRVYNPGDPKLGEGATPFMRAARSGDDTVMKLLLEHGANPQLTQRNGNTPIILAAGINTRGGNNPDRASEQGAIRAIALCLERGVDINAANASGDTAAHAALGSPTILRYLAEHGARLDIPNSAGRTPLDIALANRETDPKTIAVLQGRER